MEKSRTVDTSEESIRQLDLLLQYLEGPAFWTSLNKENSNHNGPIGGAAKGVGSDAVRPATTGQPSRSVSASAPKPSAASPRTGHSSNVISKGSPLTTATVQTLRRIIHGSVHKSFSGEWLNSSLGFFPADGPLSFGLRARRHAARGLYMCLQGFVLRHLLFSDSSERDSGDGGQPDGRRIGGVPASRLDRRRLGGRPSGDRERLVVTQADRTCILACAISDMLWRAADGRGAMVCTLRTDDRSAPSIDIVEKLQAESFTDKVSLVSFVSANISEFEKETSPGCILLLCSVVLSRGLDRLDEELARSGGDDCGGSGGGATASELRSPSLLNDRQEPRSCCINLLLAGEATAFFHNGTVYCDNGGGDELASSRRTALPPRIGVSRRADVGFLFWDGDEPSDRRTAVGSMLKTPRYPVWVTLVDGTFGLLFNMRAELVSDWHAEHQFTLCYYNGLETGTAAGGGSGGERAFTRLAVNTRVGRQWPTNRVLREEMERSTPPLERCVLTKWPDADIQWPDAARPFL